jgi:hypothetical protein
MIAATFSVSTASDPPLIAISMVCSNAMGAEDDPMIAEAFLDA